MKVFGLLITVAGCFTQQVALAEVLTAQSTRGRNLRFETTDQQFTTHTKTGVVCADSATTYTKFKLWMSEHGHGTTPTTITAIDDRCARIEKMNFVMSGTWDLQVTMSDGDTAVIPVTLP